MHHFSYRNGRALRRGRAPAARSRRAVGTPFYCYSSATLRRHYAVFASGLRRRALAALLRHEGELQSRGAAPPGQARRRHGCRLRGRAATRALAAGVPAKRIMFSGVGKTAREIAFALQTDILCFNVESEPELASAVRHRGVAGPHGARVAARQSRRRRQDPSQDLDRQVGEQVRHPDRAGACRLCPGGAPAGARGDRRRHAYRQPDHRARALRRLDRAAGRPGPRAAGRRPRASTISISVAASASPIATTTSRRPIRTTMPPWSSATPGSSAPR